MAKAILNISKAYENGFIAGFEKTKFFLLNKNATTRSDLYNFAISIAKMEEKGPTDIQSPTSFVRAEYLGNYEPLFSALYFDEVLKENTDKIDDICNRDEVYTLAEKYANTGFGILKEWTEAEDEEATMYKLISFMDKKYQEIKDELSSLI